VGLSKEFQIKEYDEALQLIEALREQVEAGEVLSVLFVSERTDGQMWGGCTSTQNVFALCGYMVYWALQRMGFVCNDAVRKSKEDE
jgi:hypothetical protein